MKEEKKRKEVQIRRWKKNQRKRAESGSLEIAKGLKIPEAYSTAKTGLRQLKEKHKKKNTRNKEQIRPFQVLEIQQENERKA